MAKQQMTKAELDQMVAIHAEMVEDGWDEDDDEIENDGQPDEYTEWQDFMGGDDWDQGQYDTDCDSMCDY
jgi:hypothetical protein